MCPQGRIFRAFDEERMFAYSKMNRLAAAIAIASVCWYAFLTPEEDMMEGYQVRDGKAGVAPRPHLLALEAP